MPLSKAKDRERKRKFQPNSNLTPAKLSNLKKAGLKMEGNRILGVKRPLESEGVPLYNPAIHRPGDTVLIQRGNRLITTVIPELDGDGHPMY